MPNGPAKESYQTLGRVGPEAQLAGSLLQELFADDQSICSTIERRMVSVVEGSVEALDPGPVVDATLGRLVELAITDFGADVAGTGKRGERFHWDVIETLCQHLDASAELSNRARTLRRGASLAEAAMERHYAQCLIDVHVPMSESTSPPASACSLAPAEALARLRLALGAFPYADNYEALTKGESAAIAAFGSPARIAFCGAGALPLTAVFFHLHTGATVTAIEIDPGTAALAAAVIGRLVDHGVLEPEAIDVTVADAASVDLTSFDLVIMASLLDNATVSAALSGLGTRPPSAGEPMVLVRSARGLVARLAYEPVSVETIEAQGFTHLGTIAPEGSVTRTVSVDDSLAIAAASSRLLTIAPREVLNTSELFVADRRA